MNKIHLIGNLVKDPETVETAKETIISKFTLAVSRKFKKEGEDTADFINIVCFNKLAELADNYLRKGNKALIIGSIQNRTYDDKEGVKRYVTEVIAEEIEFLTAKQPEEPAKQEPQAVKKYVKK